MNVGIGNEAPAVSSLGIHKSDYQYCAAHNISMQNVRDGGYSTYGGEGDEGEVGPLQEGPLLPGREYEGPQENVRHNKH